MAAKTKRNPFAHKDPNCSCDSCTSRRRQEEALPGGAGAGRDALATIGQSGQKVLEADCIGVTSGRSKRDTVALWLMYRTTEPGISNIEVARRLGISRNTLNAVISKAVREGWLKFDEPFNKLKYEITPKVIDNLNHFLDKQDKTVTLETAKGILFKPYQESEGVSDAPTTVLALKIEAVDPDNIKVITGEIVGRPKQLEE